METPYSHTPGGVIIPGGCPWAQSQTQMRMILITICTDNSPSSPKALSANQSRFQPLNTRPYRVAYPNPISPLLDCLRKSQHHSQHKFQTLNIPTTKITEIPYPQMQMRIIPIPYHSLGRKGQPSLPIKQCREIGALQGNSRLVRPGQELARNCKK